MRTGFCLKIGYDSGDFGFLKRIYGFFKTDTRST